MIRSLVVLSLMMSASVAAAKTSSDAGTDPAAKPVKEKVCRNSDDSTSRIAKRVCRTAKQWEDAQGADKKVGVRSRGGED